MSINIKNEETCRLARELAQLTGETMTGAVTAALQERLERERNERSAEARVQRLLAIGERCAGMLGDGRGIRDWGSPEGPHQSGQQGEDVARPAQAPGTSEVLPEGIRGKGRRRQAGLLPDRSRVRPAP